MCERLLQSMCFAGGSAVCGWVDDTRESGYAVCRIRKSSRLKILGREPPELQVVSRRLRDDIPSTSPDRSSCRAILQIWIGNGSVFRSSKGKVDPEVAAFRHTSVPLVLHIAVHSRCGMSFLPRSRRRSGKSAKRAPARPRRE